MDPRNQNCCSLIDLAYVASLAVTAQSPRTLPGYRPFVLVPKEGGGMAVEWLQSDYEAALPDHIRQNVVITELESFITYVKQFKTHTARIFAVANDAGAQFQAVLDYHEGGNESKAARAMHRIIYAPEYTPDFKAWQAIDGKALTQEQFLDHLRNWGDTIENQSDADLIELASSLDFTVAGQFSSHIERTNGGRKLLINEQVEGSAQVKGRNVTVPDRFSLVLPVFVGGKDYPLSADLLYRPQNGSLRIIVELRRAHLVVREAVKDLVADVKEGTEIEPFVGRLE